MSIRASRAVVGVAIIGVLAGVFWYMKRDTATLQVRSFEECVNAGYGVLPSHPEQCRTPEGMVYVRAEATSTPATSTSSNQSTSTSSSEAMIRVGNIVPNQKITSPLLVKGEARGNWYFEASFPIKLLDGAGNPIAQMPAQALGDWMTSEFVPFTATLTFAKPATATGTLILHNDNPSGAPENDRFISIPVRF